MENQEEKKKGKKKYLLLLLLLIPLLLAFAMLFPKCQGPEEKPILEKEEQKEEVKEVTPASLGMSLGSSATPSAMKPGMYSTLKIKVGNYKEQELEVYNLKLVWTHKSSDDTEKVISTETVGKNSPGWLLDHNLQKDEKMEIYVFDKTLYDLGTWTLTTTMETDRGNMESNIDVKVRN